MAEGASKNSPTSATGTTSKSSSSGSGIGLIAGLVILGCIPLIIVFGLAIGTFRGAGPNPSGATIPQPIKVNTANAELRNLLDVYGAASNIQTYLNNNGAILDKYRDNLALLQTKLESGDPKYADVRDKAAILALIPKLIEQINTLRADVTAGQKEKLAKSVKIFAADIKKLDLLVAPDIVTLATKYATENEQSGYTKYPYSKARRTEFPRNLNGASDCSSFVSSMLYQLGYIRKPQIYTTVSFYQTAKKRADGLFLVEDSAKGAISNDRIREVLQPGDIILSSSLPFFLGGDPDSNHAVMYIGNGQVVQSTSKGGKNGIQISTLEDRLRRKTQAIVRAGGES